MLANLFGKRTMNVIDLLRIAGFDHAGRAEIALKKLATHCDEPSCEDPSITSQVFASSYGKMIGINHTVNPTPLLLCRLFDTRSS